MYTIHTDASRHDDGTAAVAYKITSIYGGHLIAARPIPAATTNQAELTAVILALRELRMQAIGKVDLFTDSRYIVDTINGDATAYHNNNLWTHLSAVLRSLATVHFHWISSTMNTQMDELACQSRQQSRRFRVARAPFFVAWPSGRTGLSSASSAESSLATSPSQP